MQYLSILLFSLLLSFTLYAQNEESVDPLVLRSGEEMTAVSMAAQYNDSYYLFSENKRYIYFGDDLFSLNVADIRFEFFKVFDTSQVKREGETEYKIKSWDELFFTNFYFLKIGSDVGLFADFLIEGYQSDFGVPFHKTFVLLFDPNTMKSKKLFFIHLPKTQPKPIIRKVFSTPNTSLTPHLYVDVEYAEETNLPPIIALASSTGLATPFSPTFQLPPNDFRSVLLGLKFNYSTFIDGRYRHLYSNAYEIVDMENREIFFVSPDSTMILSPILFAEGIPYVVVADIDIKRMENANFRYVSVLDPKQQRTLNRENLPTIYVQSLSGLSYTGQDVQVGFRNIDNKPFVVKFRP